MTNMISGTGDHAATGDYRLVADVPRGLLVVTLSGFLSADAVRTFHIERRAIIASLGLPPNAHVALCDIRGCVLQSQETAATFREVMTDASLAARRLAFVTGSSLAWMQARRIMAKRPGVACFETVAEAEAWLFIAD